MLRPRSRRIPIHQLPGRGRHVVRRGDERDVVLDAVDHRLGRPAQSRRVLHEGVQHRLEIKRRAADDLQDLGGGGLLLQCLTQLGVALLQLLEQAGVLDGDHRLVRERLQQRGLLVREWTDLATEHQDGANA
jgi:hypothetical protein